MKNLIIPDEIFNNLDWKDIDPCELLGCTIIGVEPIVDGIAETADTVGVILHLNKEDGSKFAVEISNDDFGEIIISGAKIYES